MKKIILVLVSFFILPITSLSADDMKSWTPVFENKIEFNVPSGWNAVFENANPAHYMLEFVPEGQTKESWSEMFTMQGFKQMALKAEPEVILGMVGKMHQDLCGGSMIFNVVEPPTIKNRKAKSAIVGCSSIKKDHPSGLKAGMGEVGYYVAVKGDQDMYLFHKSLRTKAFDKNKSPITPDNAQKFIGEFLPINLCNKASKPLECLK